MILSLILPTALASSYVLDPLHSTLVFAVESDLYTARGRFDRWSGEVQVPDDGDLNGMKGTVTVQIGSMDTGNRSRDNLLKTSDFFDLMAFDTAEFVILDSLVTDENQIYVTGEMTIKDRTHVLEIPLEVRGAPPERLRFSGSTTLSRKRFGLVYDYAPNPIGDEVLLEMDLNVLLQEPVQATDESASTTPPSQDSTSAAGSGSEVEER